MFRHDGSFPHWREGWLQIESERQRSIVSGLLGGIGVQLNEGGDRLGINLAIPTGKMQRKQATILSLELNSWWVGIVQYLETFWRGTMLAGDVQGEEMFRTVELGCRFGICRQKFLDHRDVGIAQTGGVEWMEASSVSPLSCLWPHIQQSLDDGKIMTVQAGQMEAGLSADAERFGHLHVLAKESIEHVKVTLGSQRNA